MDMTVFSKTTLVCLSTSTDNLIHTLFRVCVILKFYLHDQR